MSSVAEFGVTGDGRTDDTAALEHALRDGDGTLELPRGDYRITRPLVVQLKDHGRFSLRGAGGAARIIMEGAGPALALIGTHATTADPKGFRPEEWERERMPTVGDIEILGRHPEADGIHISGVMQPTLTGVLVRQVRTAVFVTGRARNILISHCHLYHNTNIGVHFDKLNLHQAIITGSHISYCRRGGIRVEGSEIRNFQITGNDIEYNNNKSFGVPDADGEPTAEIYIDTGDQSVREGTISSNTIQATYSPGGANIRFIGNSPAANHKGGLWTISGNLIGSQDYNIHLTSVRGVAISGNAIYSGHQRNVLIEHCRNIVLGANVFDHNPDYEPEELCTGVRVVDTADCVVSGLLIQDSRAGRHTWKGAGGSLEREALLEFVRCQRLNLSGSQVVDGAPTGILFEDCVDSLVTGCSVIDSRNERLMKRAIVWRGSGSGSRIAQCLLGAGTEGDSVIPAEVATDESVRK